MSPIAGTGKLLLGVDLGVKKIRIAEANRKGTQFSIAKSIEVEMPEGAYRDGQLSKPDEAGTMLKEAVTRLSPRTRRAAVALSGQAVLVRRLSLPKMKLAKLRSLLESQGDQWIPFLREGAVFDLIIANPNLSEHEQEVLLVAVPLRELQSIERALKIAGLKLAALDVDVAAFQRAALVRHPTPEQGTSALLAAAEHRVRLALFQDGTLTTVRTLNPERATTEAILVDVRRSLETMLSQTHGSVLLSGLTLIASEQLSETLQGALAPELSAHIGHRLAPDFRVHEMEAQETARDMTLAFGLALVHACPPSGMNLLRQPTMAERRQKKAAVGLSLALVLGGLAYGYFWSEALPALKAEQTRLQGSLDQLNSYLAREPDIAAEEATAKALRPLLQQLNRHDPWSVSHPHLKALIPAGVTITRVLAQPPELNISGVAARPEQVADLLQALADSPHFSSPVLSFSDAGKGPVAFQILATMAPREVKAT